MFARLLLVACTAVLFWAVVVHSSDGASPEGVHVVRAGDTLWSIAEQRYGGDPREGVWELQRRNGLESVVIHPGQRLVVPSR
jgi:LysM repeat protein